MRVLTLEELPKISGGSRSKPPKAAKTTFKGSKGSQKSSGKGSLKQRSQKGSHKGSKGSRSVRVSCCCGPVLV